MNELMTILCGSWSPPEGKVTTRKMSVMKGLSNNMTDHVKESDSYADTELEILRFLRDHKNRWFSPSEIKLNIKTRFSVGNLGLILRGMQEQDFVLVQKASKTSRYLVYKFNGVTV